MRNRPNGIAKKTNGYQKILTAEFLEKCPKSVLAAIAVSFVVNHQGTDQELAEEILLKEWQVLYKQSIIPQKPFRELKNAEDFQ